MAQVTTTLTPADKQKIWDLGDGEKMTCFFGDKDIYGYIKISLCQNRRTR